MAKLTSWQRFMKKHAGEGLTIKQIAAMFQAHKAAKKHHHRHHRVHSRSRSRSHSRRHY